MVSTEEQGKYSQHDCMDAGGRVTHGAVTERRKECGEWKEHMVELPLSNKQQFWDVG